jgi:hypothetical protein
MRGQIIRIDTTIDNRFNWLFWKSKYITHTFRNLTVEIKIAASILFATILQY